MHCFPLESKMRNSFEEQEAINESTSVSVDYGTIPIETKSNKTNEYMIGVIYMLCSALFLSFQCVCVQIGKDLDYHSFELLLASGIGQFILNSVVQLMYRYMIKISPDNRLDYKSFDKFHWIYLLLRGFVGFSVAILLYNGVQLLPLGDATALFSTFPIWTIIIAYIFLKENITKIHILSLISGMIGVVLISQPTFIFHIHNTANINEIGVFFCLLSAISNGFAFLLLRKLKNIKAIYAIYSYAIGCVIGSIIYGVILGLNEWHGIKRFSDILVLIGIGIFGFGGQYCMTKSTQYIDASVGSLIRSTDVILAYLWQIVIFYTTPTYVDLIGATCILLAVIAIAV
eukprot:352426_1